MLCKSEPSFSVSFGADSWGAVPFNQRQSCPGAAGAQGLVCRAVLARRETVYLPTTVVLGRQKLFANLAFRRSSAITNEKKHQGYQHGSVQCFWHRNASIFMILSFERVLFLTGGRGGRWQNHVKRHFQNETGIIVVILKLTGGKYFAWCVLWVRQLSRKPLACTAPVADNFLAACINVH